MASSFNERFRQRQTKSSRTASDDEDFAIELHNQLVLHTIERWSNDIPQTLETYVVREHSPGLANAGILPKAS